MEKAIGLRSGFDYFVGQDHIDPDLGKKELINTNSRKKR
jgi:hypothetical protein